MRTLVILSLAASMGLAPAIAESVPGSGRTLATNADWASVPTIALQPPVMTPPAAATAPAPAGNWSSSGGWRGSAAAWQQPRPGRWNQTRGAPGRVVGRFRPRPGVFIPRAFVSPVFFVPNWWSYGLAEPAYGQRWVRYYDGAVLIDDRGYIYDTAPGIDWEGYGIAPAEYGRYDRGDMSWAPRAAYPITYGPGAFYAPPGSTTVIIQSAPAVITTTTTYEEVVDAAPRKSWRPRARRTCACK